MVRSRSGRGFTIIELLVVVSIIALLVGILLPAIGKARDAALQTQSAANLRNMSTAHAAYAADWADRQWTTVPDDAGIHGGSCAAYLQVACPPQQILGWDAASVPAMWGYFLGCDEFPGSCGGWSYYVPNTWTPNAVVGSFRLANVKSFSSYFNGRFYDPVFFAPKDTLVVEAAAPFFGQAGEFVSFEDGADLVNMSYCLSPAAMWSPEVLSRNQVTGAYWTDPTSLAAGFRSPAAGQAMYPDLKTRMLEHSWLQQKPGGDANHNYLGGETPWFFNHGYNSAPLTLFFDGHVAVMSVAECMESDRRMLAQTEDDELVISGLWSRDTPLGAGGYYGEQAYDFLVDSSYHILTIDGILGRDTIGVK